MTIIEEPTSRTDTLQMMLLAAGLPMFAFGAIAEVAGLAICGMLMTLGGAWIWARHRDGDPGTRRLGAHGWRRYSVSFAMGLGLDLSLALLWWFGSR